ncbi:hypothetical protein [Streptomyces gobiensis]|uniref:hypothetical protein n=1 Tax=Streptomyces gobiensis TaxID=2875706 RepID=UPI001E386546|nr:hypothetical protein [Streptomyces gobiensis]UGY93926.1 hypothetical protein test1122_20865 [Streptomyces gobiensis]
MAMNGGEQTWGQGGEGAPAHPGTDELRAGFQGQPNPALAKERAQQARWARVARMVPAVLVALMCVSGVASRLKSVADTGGWTIAYGVGLGCAGLGVELARRGRTRWSYLATMLGAMAMATGKILP